jgi:DNA-binding transcriptional LysR family regulator
VGIRTEWTSGSFVVNDPNLILQAAIDGVGIAHLPEMMVAAAISEGKLVPLLGGWALRMSGLFLYYLSRPPPSSAPSGVLSRKDTLRYQTDCAAKTSAIPRQ